MSKPRPKKIGSKKQPHFECNTEMFRVVRNLQVRVLPRIVSRRFQSNESSPRIKELMEQFNKNPSVMEALQKTGQLMVEKGLYDQGNPGKMSVMQQVKLLTDKDIKQSLLNFRSELDKAGIEINASDVENFMSIFQKEK